MKGAAQSWGQGCDEEWWWWWQRTTTQKGNRVARADAHHARTHTQATTTAAAEGGEEGGGRREEEGDLRNNGRENDERGTEDTSPTATTATTKTRARTENSNSNSNTTQTQTQHNADAVTRQLDGRMDEWMGEVGGRGGERDDTEPSSQSRVFASSACLEKRMYHRREGGWGGER